MGAISTPSSFVQSSDATMSPGDWMTQRVAILGGESLPQERETRLSRSARSGLSARERRQREFMAREQANAELRRHWNPSVFHVMPPRFKGIKPQTDEPWARDAIVYAQKTGSFERIFNADAFGDGTVGREEYNDESALDSNNGYRSRITATGLKRNASLGGQPLWDSSPMRYCPHVLRGIKPITREPWCVDEKIYNEDTTRDTTDDERAGGGALDLGSISHATRARARQVDRQGFYMPNWEKWSAALSA